MSIAIVRGAPFVGRTTEQRNVLFVDFETGPDVFSFRLRRLLAGLDIPDKDVSGIYYWPGSGIPLTDQVDAIRRCVAQRNIGALVVDHAALACGIEPEKSEAALRFYRAADRISLPIILIAHVTGDGERDPAQVRRPFGSIFWANGARRTWYVQRVQEQESDKIELGLYCRKVNDGQKPADFGLNVFFDGSAGPVRITPADLRLSPELNATRGQEYVLWGVLTRPMSYADVAREVDMTPEAARKVISRHPQLFEQCESGGGRGNVSLWQRRRLP